MNILKSSPGHVVGAQFRGDGDFVCVCVCVCACVCGGGGGMGDYSQERLQGNGSPELLSEGVRILVRQREMW